MPKLPFIVQLPRDADLSLIKTLHSTFKDCLNMDKNFASLGQILVLRGVLGASKSYVTKLNIGQLTGIYCYLITGQINLALVVNCKYIYQWSIYIQ